MLSDSLQKEKEKCSFERSEEVKGTHEHATRKIMFCGTALASSNVRTFIYHPEDYILKNRGTTN